MKWPCLGGWSDSSLGLLPKKGFDRRIFHTYAGQEVFLTGQKYGKYLVGFRVKNDKTEKP